MLWKHCIILSTCSAVSVFRQHRTASTEILHSRQMTHAWWMAFLIGLSINKNHYNSNKIMALLIFTKSEKIKLSQ